MRWRIEEQIIRDRIMEDAWIVIANTAGSDQQRNRYWYGEIYRECIAETLNQNLARELA